MEDITFIQYVVVCAASLLAGFVNAIAGGGGLITIPAYLATGISPTNAIATNILSVIIGTSSSAYKYFKSKFIRRDLIVPLVIIGIIGGIAGAKVMLFLDDSWLQILILIMMPIVICFVIFSKKVFHNSPYKHKKTLIISGICTLIIGVYDTFYGAGAGIFYLLAYAGLAHLSCEEAVGTSRIIMITTGLTGLIIYISQNVILWPLGIAAGLCSMLGNYIGAKIFINKGNKIVKPLIIIISGILFIKIFLNFLT